MGSEQGVSGEADTDPYLMMRSSVPPKPNMTESAGAPGVGPGVFAGLTGVIRRFIESLRSKHEERSYARRASLKVLETYRKVHAGRPDLSGKALYGEVIVSDAAMDARTAQALIRSAEQSFTEWPVARNLRFQDVVHYLVYDAYMREYTSRHWTLADIGQVVASVIPRDL
jgi:hypothetical protein